ncbi:MAG: Spy/CpxP family protein refolding chaperone [Caulobacteraceae bacterium]
MKRSVWRRAPRLGLIAALATPLLMAGEAQAQYGGQFQGPPPSPPGRNGAPPSQAPASQADYMRQSLRLRPNQDPALRDFLAAVAPPPGMTERLRAEDAQAQNLPTPQRLDRMLRRMDEMRGFVVARVAATKRFYAQLTPDQQRTFDTLGGQGQGGSSR